MDSEFSNGGLFESPNCTLVELKSGKSVSVVGDNGSPNCTLVELK